MIMKVLDALDLLVDIRPNPWRVLVVLPRDK